MVVNSIKRRASHNSMTHMLPLTTDIVCRVYSGVRGKTHRCHTVTHLRWEIFCWLLLMLMASQRRVVTTAMYIARGRRCYPITASHHRSRGAIGPVVWLELHQRFASASCGCEVFYGNIKQFPLNTSTRVLVFKTASMVVVDVTLFTTNQSMLLKLTKLSPAITILILH